MAEDELKTDYESLSDDEEDENDDDGDEGETAGHELSDRSSFGGGFGPRVGAAVADLDSQEEENGDAAYASSASGTGAAARRSTRKKLPGHPNVVQIIQKPRTHVNHTYRDLSAIPNDGAYSLPADIDHMTFPEKLFHLLASTTSYAQDSIAWRPHGRAFRIKSEAYLQKYGWLKLYFGYARIQRFFKQLLNHDFKQITQGPDKDCFYHEYFLRGMPHLLPYFPEATERRRLLPDPENEPDFAAISHLFHLPGDRRLVVQEARNRLQRRGIQIWETVFASVVSSEARNPQPRPPQVSPNAAYSLGSSLPTAIPSSAAQRLLPSSSYWPVASNPIQQGLHGFNPSSQFPLYQGSASSSIYSSLPEIQRLQDSERSSSLLPRTITTTSASAAAGETDADDSSAARKPPAKKNRKKHS